MKVSERLDSLRLRAGRMWREHKDRSIRNHKALPHGAAPMLWVWFLVFVAACALLGSTWMLLVFIAGSVGHVDWTFDWRSGSDGVRRANWSAEANVHALIGVGLFLASAAVAAFNAVWLHVRTHLNGIFRNVVTSIGALVALFMISGAIVVQQWGTDDRTRDEVAATQTAQAGVAAIDADIAGIETEMQRLCAPDLTTWQAQACRDGSAAWQRRIQITQGQNDANSRARLLYMQSSLASAEQGDRWREQLADLRRRRAAAAVTTVQASVQQVQATGWFATFSHTLEDLRKPFIAVLGELLAMTMFGVALAALRSRQQLVETSGWADEAHRIEDHTDEEPIASNPANMQTVMREEDLETGEVKVHVKPRAYWRTVKKGKKQKIEIPPEVQPDETGVAQDGGQRIGTKGEHEPLAVGQADDAGNIANAHSDAPQRQADEKHDDRQQHEIQPTLSLEQDDIEAFSYADDESAAVASDVNVVSVAPIGEYQVAQYEDAGANNQSKGRIVEDALAEVGEPDHAEEGASDVQEPAQEPTQEIVGSEAGSFPIDHQSPPPATEPETQEADEPQAITNPARLLEAAK